MQSNTITGTVFDPSGAPAPFVALTVNPGGIPFGVGDMPGSGPNKALKSDASGHFEIHFNSPIRTAQSGNRREDYLFIGRDLAHNFATAVRIEPMTTNLDLHLEQGLTLSGSVQDAKGTRIKPATLTIRMTHDERLSTGGVSAAVDERGAFAFNALPLGRGYMLDVRASGFVPAEVEVGANQTETNSLQLAPITLQPADQRLEGVVVGPDSKPVPTVDVQAFAAGQRRAGGWTDAKGHFALMVGEGEYEVRVVPGNPLGSASAKAHSGDLNVVLKLGQDVITNDPR
jgi:hypothetical protein